MFNTSQRVCLFFGLLYANNMFFRCHLSLYQASSSTAIFYFSFFFFEPTSTRKISSQIVKYDKQIAHFVIFFIIHYAFVRFFLPVHSRFVSHMLQRYKNIYFQEVKTRVYLIGIDKKKTMFNEPICFSFVLVPKNIKIKKFLATTVFIFG